MGLDVRDPLWEEYTICTAVAPGAVFTVGTYGNTSPPYGPGSVRNFSDRGQRTCRSAAHRNDQGQDMTQVR